MFTSNSAINLFSTSRPVKRIARDGTEEVWIEKVYFTTEETFPTVLRRSQVVDIAVMDISPIENALSEVAEKTKELSALNLRYQNLAKTAQEVSTNALSMVLNSAVDAPLNTGISAFRQMFFTDDWAARNPEQVELAEKLRAAIDEQVRLFPSHIVYDKLTNASYRPESSTAVSNYMDLYVLPNSFLSTKRSRGSFAKTLGKRSIGSA